MNTFSLTISKQAVAELPTVEFNGAITMVETPEQLEAALADLCTHTLVGFDTETKPSFKKGCVNKVALMQLSTDTHNYLIRLNKLGIPATLRQFLENPAITKVGLSIHDDFNVMRRTEPLDPQGFIELQNFVKEYAIADCSLQKIYAIVFGRRISKRQRLTNWEAPALTPQQQMYAALDSWACLHIYRYLLDGKFDPASSPYRAPEPEPAQS
ncbi:MAG: 3'-5' exonuclease domain-containing protein 2 [Muribaculaceae bacterium]|nr:3'-5' exonuclease domain-containing protein 2 [Muribaculaceae bacterium]